MEIDKDKNYYKHKKSLTTCFDTYMEILHRSHHKNILTQEDIMGDIYR